MNHVTDLLTSYHDGELAPGARRRVEAHLASCQECREELAQLEQLSDLLGAYTLPDTLSSAEAFRAQVGLRVARRARPRRNYLSWSWHIVPVALLCALGGLMGLLAAGELFVGVCRLFEWFGFDVAAALGLPSVLWAETWLEGMLFSWVRGMGGLVLRLCLYGISLVMFGAYAGWVGVLWRTSARSLSGKEV